MNERTEMPRAGTPEFFAARQVASELMIRALFQMHPNKEQVRLYLDRMLGMSLVQPGLLDQPGVAALVKQVIAGFVEPPPTQEPGL